MDLGLAKRRRWDTLARRLIYVAALAAILVIILIFVFVGKEAMPVLTSHEVQREASLNKLFLAQQYGTEEAPLPYVWQPISAEPKYSLMPLFLGTLKVTLVAMLFAAPLAILAAIFSTEFAPNWLRESLKPVIELLAGIPSVSESTMIARDAELAAYEGGRVHVQHVSAKESVEAFERAKAAGGLALPSPWHSSTSQYGDVGSFR